MGLRRNRVVARLVLVSVATLCSLGLITALAILFEHIEKSSQAIASSVGQIPEYPVTSVPVNALPPLPAAAQVTQHLLVNALTQVNGGLVLMPGSQPPVPLAGELYYDKNTSQPYFYNGSSFISLQPTATAQQSITNQTFVTNTTGPMTVVEQINNGASLSGLTTDGVVYATGASTVTAVAPVANGVLATNASGLPVMNQTLPVVVQSNITSTGVVMSGSISQGFGTINTGNSIETTTTLQGGTIIVGADGSSQPASVTVRGGIATGTDVTGASTIFDAGNGTGNGGSGDLIFRTAASNALPVTLGEATEFEAYTQSSM
ncbi:MAG: hypothetical protein ACREBW_02205, partial [Candidatus Micrarchaeaceae archaeon]